MKSLLATTSANVSHIDTGSGATASTVQAMLRIIKNSTGFGGVQDATTDNVTPIVNMSNAAIAETKKVVLVPPATKFTYPALMAAMPAGVTIFNLSGINDSNTAGYKTRTVGFIGSSTDVNDMQFAIEDAHHPLISGNNLGTAGSTSATNRLFSIMWQSGKYALGAADNLGYRSCAMLQFRKESATTWSYGLRSLAPWSAIAGNYERWATGQSIASANVYRTNGTNHYVSAAGAYPATTGATPPTHTTGTVSDGGVSWTYLDSTDRGIFLVDQYGHWLIGNGSLNSTWRHKVTPTDPVQAYVGEMVAGGISQSASLKLTPTNGAGSEVLQPFLQGNTSGLSILKSDGSASLLNTTDSGSIFAAIGSTSATPDTATGATPSVAGRNTYYIGNAGAQSITGFTGGFDGQRVRVIVTNANTSFTNSATFNLGGSANIATPAAFSVIDFEKVPASISDRWIEVGRSIK
jgi:hypothetical protein